MRIVILGSGSSGNATYVELGEKRLLIDIGLSCHKVENELAKLHTSVRFLDGIFISHSHDDHIKGLRTLVGRATVPIFVGEQTQQEIATSSKAGSRVNLSHYPLLRRLEPDVLQTWPDSSLRVLPMRSSHDVQCFGFYLEAEEGNLVYYTDSGFLPKLYAPILRNRDYYIFESNYDPELLRTCKYPSCIKQRIASDKGHMSNAYSAHCISNLVGARTKKVVLAHISENSNTPASALDTHRRALQNVDFTLERVVCAVQRQVLTVVDET